MQWHSAVWLLSLSLCLATFVSQSVAEDAQTTSTQGNGTACKPGSRFRIDCNWCFCSNEGRVACTRRRCPSGDFSRNPDQPECEGKASWKKDCNWCHCVNGRGVCSKMACLSRNDPPALALPGASLSQRHKNECTEDSVWYQGCNTCHCTNGLSICTKRACAPGFVQDPDQPECEGESQWKKDCNWCNCVNGKGICSKMACQPQHPSLVALTPEEECTEGSVWYKDCNRCHCTNGVGSCTRMACRPVPVPLEDPQPTCTNGSHWRVNCNWCTCANGVAACTRMPCTNEISSQEPECTNGSRWRHECNQCACIDGKSVCTKRTCLPASQPTTLTTMINDKTNICHLPPIKASHSQCTGFFKKWTYRVEKGECEAIVYGGCGGTKNLFDDQETCKSACGATTSGNLREELPAAAECTEGSVWYNKCNTCHCTNGLASCTRRPCRPGFTLNPDQPECEGESRWRKDCNWCNCINGKGVCTQKGCLSDTGDIVGRPKLCFKVPEVGPCFASMIRFAFVPERNRCERFTFGGCQGNDNNFETPEECHHTCGGDQPILGNDSSGAAEQEVITSTITADLF